MENIKRLEVLGGCKLPLKLTNLYNKNGVHIGALKIPKFLIFILISLPTIYIAPLQIWYCFDERFNLKATSNTLLSIVALIHMGFVYLWLTMKSELIVETIDHLQDVVNKSKYAINSRCSLFKLYLYLFELSLRM